MAQNIDELALSCNILLGKLFYLCSNSMISREQLIENSRLKAKFLLDNIDNIESLDIKADAIKKLNMLIVFLPLEERESWFYNTPI